MIVALVAVLLAQAPAPPAEGTAVLSGKVVDKASGEPIAGAVVAIRTLGTAVSQERLTDPRGMFEFPRLPAGRYDIRAAAGQYRYTHVPGTYRQAGADAAAPLELKDGERRTDLVIELARSLAISGRVVDEEGHPLANVEVSGPPQGRMGSAMVGRPRATDDRGMFRIYGLTSGRYVLCASGRMGASFEAQPESPAQFVRTCYPASTDPAHATEIVLGETDVEGVEIRMQRRDTYTIAGTVLTATGTPPSNVSLTLYRLEGSGSMGTGTRLQQPNFVISRVVPGTYEITATLRQDMHGSAEGIQEWGVARVEVTTSNVEGLLVQMKRPVAVAGRLIFEDPPQEVLTGAIQVAATRPRPGSSPDLAPVKVAPDGTFTLTGLFGSLVLRPVGQLPRNYVLKSVTYRGRDITWEATEFDGAPGHEVEMVLTNQTSELSGRVLDETGNPAANASVVLFPADPARWRAFERTPVSVRAGAYKRPGLLAGEYLVVALKVEDLRALDLPDDYDRLASIAERVTILERETRTADLQIATLPERQRPR